MRKLPFIILSAFLFACDSPGKRKEKESSIIKVADTLSRKGNKGDTFFQYKMVVHDPDIKSGFRIIYDDYRLNFDPKTISAYCDSIIRLKDERKEQYANIRQEVNNQTYRLYLNNDEIILKTFIPKITNTKTHEIGKSLLIASYKNICGEDKAVFFIITPENDTVRINRINLDGCIN